MTCLLIDTETTGGDFHVAPYPRVIEAAWLRLSDPVNLAIEETFCQRYNPEQKSTLGALATHHILDEELTGCPSYTTFALPEDAEYIIGHNVDYDWNVIGQPPVKRICTLALSMYIYPELDSHSQSAMLYYSMGDRARPLLKNAHSALQDVENCFSLLAWLLMRAAREYSRKEGIWESWEEVWQFSEYARIPTVMTFGKHRGQPIKDIPSDYKRWLLGQADIDPYLAKALKGETA